MKQLRVRSFFPLVIAFWFLGLLLAPSLAFAAGKVEWKSKALKETDKAWKVEVAIHLAQPPDIPTMPMKFEFQPTMYFERSMLDGDKLVERKVALENRQALIESVDVGFLDPGSGKIEKRTRFVFKVTRGHGYEAGEYQVTIRDGRSGTVIGSSAKLVFQGENEIIDRRAMIFTGEKKKKKTDSAATGDKPAEDKGSGESGENGDESAESTDSASENAAAEPEAPAPEEPKAIKEKPGGCGCRISTRSSQAGSALSALALVGLAFAARRRSAR